MKITKKDIEKLNEQQIEALIYNHTYGENPRITKATKDKRNGQIRTTIPKPITIIKKIDKGTKLNWTINQETGTIEVKKQ